MKQSLRGDRIDEAAMDYRAPQVGARNDTLLLLN